MYVCAGRCGRAVGAGRSTESLYVMREAAPGWHPYFDDDEALSLIGKHILVGITHRSHSEEITSLEQFHGEIVRASKDGGIIVLLASAEERWLPPDLSRIETAPPGDYRLKSSGETVTNPDYLVTWTVYPPEQ